MILRSLRFKLSLSHGLIIALVFISIGLARYQTVAYRTQRSFDQTLVADAGQFAAQIEIEASRLSLTPADSGESPQAAVEQLRPFFAVTDDRGHVQFDEHLSEFMREMISRNQLQNVLTQHSGFESVDAHDGTSFRFISMPLPSAPGASRLFLHVGRSTRSIDSVLRDYFMTWLGFVPIILLASVGVAWILAGRALKPFEDVAQTAQQITTANLNTKIATNRNEQEIQKLVEAFNIMSGRLNDSFQQMRRFNADVAHELRTPLSILQGETEIALRSQSIDEESRALLESNVEELERLTQIVNDLLVLAQAEAGEQTLTKASLNVKPLVEDLVEQMRLLAMERNVRIELQELPDVQIQGDALWIRRALLNLLDNAIKYSRNESRIEVGGRLEKEMVWLQFRDEGIGIAERDVPHIFERFYRTDPARSRSSGGIGLGLALVKWVVEAHQGSIQVKSALDQGSMFQVAFPLAEQVENAGYLRSSQHRVQP